MMSALACSRRARPALGLGIVIAFAFATSATAAGPRPTPGIPAIQQYVEAIPTSGGDVATGAKGRRTLPAQLARKIGRLGGKDAASLKDLVASAASGAPQRPLATEGDAQAAPLPSGSAGAVAGALAGGSSGTLVFVIAAVAATALVGAGVAFRRSRG